MYPVSHPPMSVFRSTVRLLVVGRGFGMSALERPMPPDRRLDLVPSTATSRVIHDGSESLSQWSPVR